MYTVVLRHARAFTLVALLLGGLAGPAEAWQEPPDSVVEIEPVLVRVLGSTIGTSTPYSVSVVAGPELRRASADAFLEEALRAVPGVQIQNRFNFAVGERLSVRGFGPRAQFGIRGVRVLVDGIPATLPDGQSTLDHLDLSSLGRVEVLRGPNATLYGNAAGGVLHFRTLDPVEQPRSATFGTTTGSHGLLSLQGSTNGTLGDAGYRVGFNHLEYDGFRENPVAGDGSTYGGATRSVVNGVLTVPMAGGSLRVVANGVDLDAENPGSLPDSLVSREDRPAWGFNVISRTGKEVRQGQLGATWSGAGSGTTEIAAWGVRREFENPIPGTIIGVDRNAGGARALLSRPVDVGVGTLAIGGGVELELQRDDRLNWENDGGDKGAVTLSQIENVRSTGLFAQTRLDLEPRVSLTAGLRYDHIRFSADDRFLQGGDPDDSGSRTMSAFSPSAGIVVDAGSGIELFGSVARSFESPTTTELVNRPTGSGGFNPDLEPQTGTTFEGGARARLGDRWAAEATLFRTDLEGELIPFEIPTDPGRQYFRNAGASHHEGWELSLEGRPSASSHLRVAYTRVDARFEDYRTDSDDFSGNRVPGLAPHRVDALGVVTRGAAFLELRGLYQDEVPVDDAGTAAADAYFLADVRAGLRDFGTGAARLSPYVAISNLFDERYTGSVTVNAFGRRYFEPGPGRTFRVGLDVTWGG